MLSVTGKENEEECQRQVKWVLQQQPHLPSYRYFPLVALESSGNLLHTHTEGRATTFQRCYSQPDTIKIKKLQLSYCCKGIFGLRYVCAAITEGVGHLISLWPRLKGIYSCTGSSDCWQHESFCMCAAQRICNVY